MSILEAPVKISKNKRFQPFFLSKIKVEEEFNCSNGERYYSYSYNGFKKKYSFYKEDGYTFSPDGLLTVEDVKTYNIPKITRDMVKKKSIFYIIKNLF